MKKIIIFTNIQSLSDVDMDTINRNDITLSIENKILLFDESDNSFKATTNFNGDGLYFVWDYIIEEDFISAINNNTNSDFYILKHQRPDYELNGFLEEKKGQHQSKVSGGYYPDVVDILSDTEDNKFNRIFDAIFSFDKELEDLLKPFATASPFEIKNNEGEDLKTAKTELQNYIEKKFANMETHKI